MKTTITNYTFNKTAKTITFTDYSAIVKELILAVINTTTGTVIFRPDDVLLGGTVASNVLTLTYDTSAMNNADKLMIIYADVETTGGTTDLVQTSFTRPSDTTPYAALDVVSTNTTAGSATIITFANCSRLIGGSGYITKARLTTDNKATAARFKLHLFNVAPATQGDNAGFASLWTQRVSQVGEIVFEAMGTENSTNSTQAKSQNDTVRLAFKTNGGKDLYGILEVLDGTVPIASQNFFLELTCEKN